MMPRRLMIFISIVFLALGCAPRAEYKENPNKPSEPLTSPTPSPSPGEEEPTPTPTPKPSATPTPTPVPREVFAVFGDQGTGTGIQYDVAEAMYNACQPRGCEFAVGLGDNFYPIGVSSVTSKQFQEKFEVPYGRFGTFDFFMLLGNHDRYPILANPEAQVEYTKFSPRWRMPYFHYSVPTKHEWLNIYALDTMKLDDQQVNKMKDQICFQKGWKIVAGHHPTYSNGKHGGDQKKKAKLEPVFKDCGVQVYFAGHDHHQEHISACGYETFVQGAAAKLRPVKKETGPAPDHVQRFASSEYGFAIVDVTEDEFFITFHGVRGQVIYQWKGNRAHMGLP